MDYAVRMEHIEKSYSGVKVLKDINFDLAVGEIHALVGENGAGKSTLIKILSGAISHDQGTIEVNGAFVEMRNPMSAKKLGIQTIYQELSLVPHLSIANNIFLGVEDSVAGMVKQRKINARASEIMSQLGLNIDVRTPVNRLGIGVQFFTEICRCLVSNARIVIMDEPTSAMSPIEYESFLTIISKLRERGISIIYISHHLEEIFQICDRVTVLRDGIKVDTCAIRDLTLQQMIRMMVGKDISEHLSSIRNEEYKPGEVILEANGLTNKKLKNVSIKLHRGEVLGVTGLLGAGKTELAQALFGGDPLSEGNVTINGQAVNLSHPGHVMKQQVAMVPEDRKRHGLFQQFSVKENLAIINLQQIEKFKWFVDRKKENAIARNMIQTFNVKCLSPNQKIISLSGGNQQKIVLAKWIKRSPLILLLDEPTRGIDVGSKEEIYKIIRDMARNGISIILFSSELPEVLALSNRIMVLNNGMVSGELISDQANQEDILLMATGGMKWNR